MGDRRVTRSSSNHGVTGNEYATLDLTQSEDLNPKNLSNSSLRTVIIPQKVSDLVPFHYTIPPTFSSPSSTNVDNQILSDNPFQSISLWYSRTNSSFYQSITYSPPYGSWIIRQSEHNPTVIEEDGSLIIITPFDEVFLMLLTLDNWNSRVYQPTDVLFGEDSELLSNCVCSQKLKLICDVQEIDEELMVCRLNESRALSWICCKVESIVKCVKFGRIRIEDAVEIVAENLNTKWKKLLRNYYEKIRTCQVECTEVDLGQMYREKGDAVVNGEVDGGLSSKRKWDGEPSAKKVSRVQRKLAKVDTSQMKSISSYFKKKPKD